MNTEPLPSRPTKSESLTLHLSPDEVELLEVVLDGVRDEADTSPGYRETAFLLRCQLTGARDAARICPTDDGSGLYLYEVPCPDCRSTGRRLWQHAIEIECETCGGKGWISDLLAGQMARRGE